MRSQLKVGKSTRMKEKRFEAGTGAKKNLVQTVVSMGHSVENTGGAGGQLWTDIVWSKSRLWRDTYGTHNIKEAFMKSKKYHTNKYFFLKNHIIDALF